MRLLQNKWPSDRSAEGYLFFAQCVEEFLFDYTPEIFRVPTLNTPARIDEAIYVIESVKHKHFHVSNISAVISETIDSIHHDEVAKDLIGNRLSAIEKGLSDLQNEDELIRTLIYTKRIIGDKYTQKWKEKISVLLKDGMNKTSIHESAEFLCTSLIIEGYAKEAIYNGIKKFFFRKDVTSPEESFAKFASSFSGEPRIYHLYCGISGEFSKFFEDSVEPRPTILEDGNKIKGATPNFIEKLTKNGKRILHFKRAALDHYSAQQSYCHLLGFLEAAARFYAHKADLSWEKDMYVIADGDSRGRFIQDSVSNMHRVKDHSTERAGQPFKDKIRLTLSSSSDDGTRDKLIAGVIAHLTALKSPTPEAQLISLWSGVEAMLPQKSENHKGPSIDHYINFMIPSIMIGYVERMLKYCYNDFRSLYGSRFLDIISKSPYGNGKLDKFSAVVLLDECKEIKNELLNLCADNPLAKYKVHYLQKKLSSLNKINSTISNYRKRVEWQIRRIYRTRNNIVHAGYGAPFTDSLLSNLHDYFDAMTTNFDKYLSMSRSHPKVDSTFDHIRKEFDLYMDLLQKIPKSEKMSGYNYKEILMLP
jgi:hypothetical protein